MRRDLVLSPVVVVVIVVSPTEHTGASARPTVMYRIRVKSDTSRVNPFLNARPRTRPTGSV